jgi:hypothetical protein
VILADRGRECVLERRFRKCLAVGHCRVQLFNRGAERFSVRTWLGERQVDQLEHRLQVAVQRPAVQSLEHLVDVRTHDRRLAGELLAHVEGGQLPEPALLDDPIGRLRRDEVHVGRQ